MSKSRALIFDLFGTLLDSAPVFNKIHQAMMIWLKQKYPELDTENLFRMFIINYWKSFLAETEKPCQNGFKSMLSLTREAFQKACLSYSIPDNSEYYIKILLTNFKDCQPFSESNQILDFLKEKVDLTILSNADEQILPDNLKNLKSLLNNQPFFMTGTGRIDYSCFTSSEEARCYKPSLELFQYHLAKFYLSYDEIWMVGDSNFEDIYGAWKAGLKTVQINRNPAKKSDLNEVIADLIKHKVKADFEITSLTELPDLIGG